MELETPTSDWLILLGSGAISLIDPEIRKKPLWATGQVLATIVFLFFGSFAVLAFGFGEGL